MKIMVGLSGGVDSAVAAYLLKQQGHDVTCAFMRNWDSLTNDDISGNPTLNDPVCPQEEDWKDAQAAADSLGLPLLRIDFIKEYWDEVFHTFLSEYRKGRTPNPDILCNKYIKFDSFFRFAEKQGFSEVATGHYAKMAVEDGRNVIQKADDRNKDQSYFLAQISVSTLDHIHFPLGNITKPEVRRIAKELNLPIAEKKDSTGICFIGERHFREFLSNYLPMKPGKIIEIDNKKTVGEHQGVLYYTIGQRKGLNIGGTGPYYVCGKNIETNELYVCDEQHQDYLYSDSCLVSQLNWLKKPDLPFDAQAKFRYRQADSSVRLEDAGNGAIRILYPQTVRSVTPGQEAVFYKGDTMLGGGVIDQVFRKDEDLMDRIRDQVNSAG